MDAEADAATAGAAATATSTSAASPSRTHPQYHYFYGSTGGASVAGVGSSPSINTDYDSLVGESLLPTTDNEADDDTPRNVDLMKKDLQQTFMTNGESISLLVGNNGNTGSDNGNGNGNGNGRRRSFSCFRFFSLTQLRENHPVAHMSLLTISLALFMFISTIVIFPNSHSATVVTMPEAELTFKMLFPTVDRGDYDDPVSGILQKELFHPSLRYKGSDPSREFIFPFPTGAFWTNLVLPPTADRELSYPMAVYPYAYKWSPSLLQVSYPARHRKEDAKAIHDYFFPDLTIGASETTSERYITKFDPLSVTLRYTTGSGGSWESYLVQGSPYITIKYDKATPSIRALSVFNDIYCPRDDDETSTFDANKKFAFGICSTTSDSNGHSTVLRGVQFIFVTQEGMQWIMFASEPISLVFNERERTTVVGAEPFNGVLRIAFIPSPAQASSLLTTSVNNTVSVFTSPGLQRLIYHAGVYPVGGDVRWTFQQAGSSSAQIVKLGTKERANDSTRRLSSSSSTTASSSRVGTVHFDFTVSTTTPSSRSSTPKQLLMLGLPHHAAAMSSNSQLNSEQFDLVYKCIKGPLRPVLGKSWSYDEPLPSIGFDGGAGSSTARMYTDPGIHRTIVESLQEDIKLALPTSIENVYGFGKQAARLAQLAHVGHMLLVGNETEDQSTTRHHNTSNSDYEILSDLVNLTIRTLSDSLTGFLVSNVTDGLVYDANLGGLVTKDGLLNQHADFGNGRYNDHHFHYGYILYACAILGKLDPSFANQYHQEVDAIYFDIAHDSNFASQDADGVFFPGARHKVWFDGHSFASGLFHFGNGKSQESSSEAVNGYYGAYLWSLVRHGAATNPDSDTSAQTDFARLLLATEIRGARTYWHMVPPDSSSKGKATTVYTPEFSKNYMVGNLGMLDAISSTWFGTESLYVHMINLIPVTAVTGELFDRNYVAEEYPNILEPLHEVEMAWKGFVIADHAIIDAQSAWEDARDLFSPQLDAGLSKSQVLYWIATRSGFQAKNASSVSKHAHKKIAPKRASGKGTCETHPLCAKANLTGDCCPAGNGLNLGCCAGL